MLSRWNAKTDLALVRGIHKHGYGNYEAVRMDREFSWAFSDVSPSEAAWNIFWEYPRA